MNPSVLFVDVIFQSTQPEWAATDKNLWTSSPSTISIHAARMGCDIWLPIVIKPPNDFNPRSPNGLRQRLAISRTLRLIFQSTQPEWAATALANCKTHWWTFQSTQPEWAATNNGVPDRLEDNISIHAARMGCDTKGGILNVGQWYFNPRSPNGLRQSHVYTIRKR